MTAWWGSPKQVSPRLMMEVLAMRESYGSTFKLVVPNSGHELYWEGTVEINLSTLASPYHVLHIVYHRDHPSRPPAAYVVRPNIFSPKHQYQDGQLCLFNPMDGAQYGWNPARSTAVTVVSWAIEWLYALYTWRATGHWPGTEESMYGKPRWPGLRAG